jgi:cystathionine beta-lyase
MDVTMQALTKYVGGHSDLLLGSVTVCADPLYKELGDAHQLLGMCASPDDCTLALRGLQTLAVRLAQLQQSALEIAYWLRDQPEVELVLHPALPDHPGHDLWKRDFTGSSSVFSVLFNAATNRDFIIHLIESLELFKLGFSWGGVTSLVMRYEKLRRVLPVPADRIVRFNVGLETVPDLIDDLQRAFSVARNQNRGPRRG